jgi:protein phosphatase
MRMRIRSTAIQDMGKRHHQQDAQLVIEPWRAAVVADGSGGSVAEEAIAAFAQTIISAKNQLGTASRRLFPMLLERAVENANRAIRDLTQVDRNYLGVGSTMSAMILAEGRGYFAHVGDGRIYLLRGDELTQLTEDHTLVNEQLKQGLITEEEALTSRYRQIITRTLGFEETVMIDRGELRVFEGDRFLLCTDGLWRVIGDDEIKACIAGEHIEDAIVNLDAAARRNIEDNLTAILIEVDEPS